jgi:hypothetical protein
MVPSRSQFSTHNASSIHLGHISSSPRPLSLFHSLTQIFRSHFSCIALRYASLFRRRLFCLQSASCSHRDADKNTAARSRSRCAYSRHQTLRDKHPCRDLRLPELHFSFRDRIRLRRLSSARGVALLSLSVSLAHTLANCPFLEDIPTRCCLQRVYHGAIFGSRAGSWLSSRQQGRDR